ncbi:MAG: CHAT domain-containing protein, partial [Planctomycetes bacterium]|nr:CHAT domain-containing protein [Planctomycetota bacterium]
ESKDDLIDLQKPQQALALGGVNYGAPSSKSKRGFFQWRALPGTRAEVESIVTLFGQGMSTLEPTLLVNDDATEQALRAAVAGGNYVHLATHGFFRPDLASSVGPNGTSDSAANPEVYLRLTEEAPGLLAGIALAGSNNSAATSAANDGYLTAEEFCALDLEDCKLIVLSACDSGVGEEIPGEGLISLCRASRLAGARSIISSLWKVDDFYTRHLMVAFYSKLWLEGMSPSEALHEAKLEMLIDNRIRFGHSHPEYWSAFVLNGSWN